MGDCLYCHKPAGIFRYKHSECEAAHSSGINEIKSLASGSLQGSADLSEVTVTLGELASKSFISPAESKALLLRVWHDAIESSVDQSGIDADTEGRLLAFTNAYGISQQELNNDQAYQKLVKALILRDIAEGKLPNRAKIGGSAPVNVQKGEQIIWLYPKCDLLMDKTHREYAGRSAGVSVRVMKGVYYRTSGFHGYPVERTEKAIVDSGVTVMTNKNISFVGTQKSFRLPYKKILSFVPFSDGIGIVKDTANAKLQTLVTGDGWFSYNLAIGLSKLEMD